MCEFSCGVARACLLEFCFECLFDGGGVLELLVEVGEGDVSLLSLDVDVPAVLGEVVRDE